MSHPKLWLQFLPPPGAGPVASGRSLSIPEPVAVGGLGPHGRGRSFPSPDTGGRAGGARPGEGCQPHPRQTCVLGAQPAQAAVRWRRALLLGRVTA